MMFSQWRQSRNDTEKLYRTRCFTIKYASNTQVKLSDLDPKLDETTLFQHTSIIP
jgi:hypothetical protein